jgi:hypothetical protein
VLPAPRRELEPVLAAMPYSAKHPRHVAPEVKEDYYTVLGVHRNASPEQIAEAYRRLALECHPDVKPDDPRAAKQFLQVQAAFEVLSDSAKRAKYNRTSISFATTYKPRPATTKPRPATANHLGPEPAKRPTKAAPQQAGNPRPATEAIQRAAQAIENVGGTVKYGPTGAAQVYLAGKSITDAGLVHLQGLSQLEVLWLYNTNITDAGLVHLQGLSQLQRLMLGNTKVTDAGLVHLQGLSQLQRLMLGNTRVTHQGVKRLRLALPTCKTYC